MVGGIFGKLATVLSHGFQTLAGYRRPGALLTGAFFVMATVVALLAWTPEASAYSQYTPAKGGEEGCAACHGDFNNNAGYLSLQDLDPAAWPTETMTAHSNDMLQGACAACHGSGPKFPVLMTSSNDATLNLSCSGCHGRATDAGTDISVTGGGTAPDADPTPADGTWLTVTGSGAGLRQAHWNANRTVPRADGSGLPDVHTQICADCHADANPSYYTPVDEDVIPPYYQLPPLDVVQPTDPCNVPPGTESIYGSLGLDNDGDLLIDGEEAVCAANTAPVANAGGPYTATLGNLVNLDGSGTTDTTPTGTLEFTWSLLAKPGASALLLGTGSINQDLSANADFTPDAHGDYTIELSVTDGLDIGTNQVVISTTNNAPVAAFANEPYSGQLTDTVTLDGTPSDDVDPGDTITYEWSLPTRPVGSGATLTSLVDPTTSFTIDVYGTYQAELVVRDQLGLASAPATTTITTSNTVPVAGFVGLPYSGAPGIPVDITGDVTDPDVSAGEQTATWTFNMNAVPGASLLPLGPTSITQDGTAFASFTPDVEGIYTVQVEVGDGTATSAPVTTDINTLNTPPTVLAGGDQAVAVNDLVQLDGSATDADGHTLDITWSQVSGPAATLSDVKILNPTFTADSVGTYVWQLAADDGYVVVTDQMQVVAGSSNTAPTADAGGPYSGFKGDTVTLTGIASDDDVGDTLTYSWALLSEPVGSTTTIVPVGPTSTEASLFIDVTGDYLVEFTATDDGSPPLATSATTTVTTNNTQPLADAGSPQTVDVNQLVNLSGSVTDPDDFQSHTYAWTFAVLPGDSGLTNLDITQSGLPDDTAASFTPDVKGNYSVQLIVTDDGTPPSPSAAATVAITTNNSPPIANAGGDQLTVPLGGTVDLDGTLSDDPDGDNITYSWAFTSKPVGSLASIVPDGVTPGLASFVADLKGDYNVELTVTDDDVVPKSDTDAMLARVANSVPTAHAGDNQNIVDGGLVTLDGSLSSDPDPGETATLTYNWSLAKPGGSAAGLSDPNIVNPTFVADAAGTYTAQLTVSDGFSVSAPDFVDIVNTSSVASPDIVLSPTAHDFGVVPVGTTQTTTMYIKNLGDNILTISGVTTVGGDFAYNGPAAPITIFTNSQVTFEATYTPSTLGAATGSVTFASNDPDTPNAVITLDGTGEAAAPVLALSTTGLDFGSVASGTTQTGSVVIKNLGTADLTVTGVSVSLNAAEFTLPGGPYLTDIIVAPNSQVSIPVNYTPGGTGTAITGSLDITTLTAGNPSATLDGTGVAGAPDINLSPAALDFGTAAVLSSKKGFVYIQNVGNADLQVTSVSVTGSDFLLENDPGAFTLSPNRQIKLRFTYTASAPGLATETLTVNSDSPGEAASTVILTGTGEAGAPSINLSTTALNFGSVSVGTTQTGSVVIQNLGTADLSVDALSVPANTAVFALGASYTFPIIVGPSSQVTIPVTYTPGAAGAATPGSLDITSNAGNPSVTLDGTGVAASPTIALSTTALDFGSVEAGATKTVNLYIRNFGTADLTVTGVSVSGNTEFTLPGGPYLTDIIVAPNSQVTIPVTYTPGVVEGPATQGTLNITTLTAGPASATLDGVSVAPGA